MMASMRKHKYLFAYFALGIFAVFEGDSYFGVLHGTALGAAPEHLVYGVGCFAAAAGAAAFLGLKRLNAPLKRGLAVAAFALAALLPSVAGLARGPAAFWISCALFYAIEGVNASICAYYLHRLMKTETRAGTLLAVSAVLGLSANYAVDFLFPGASVPRMAVLAACVFAMLLLALRKIGLFELLDCSDRNGYSARSGDSNDRSDRNNGNDRGDRSNDRSNHGDRSNDRSNRSNDRSDGYSDGNNRSNRSNRSDHSDGYSDGNNRSDGHEGADEGEQRKRFLYVLAAVSVATAAMSYMIGVNDIAIVSTLLSGPEPSVFIPQALLYLPALLIAGALADIKGGKYLPIATLGCSLLIAPTMTRLASPEAYTQYSGVTYFLGGFYLIYIMTSLVALARRSRRPIAAASLSAFLLFSFSGLGAFTSRFYFHADSAFSLTVYIGLVALLLAIFYLSGSLQPRAAEPAAQAAAPAKTLAELVAAYGITEREAEVLRLLLAGKSTAAIAAELVVTENTVYKYISSMNAKAKVGSRTELIAVFMGAKA